MAAVRRIRRGGSDSRLVALAAELAAGPPVVRAVARVPARGRADIKAALIRRAYDLDWLPSTVADNIRRVDRDAAAGRVVLTLSSGSTIIDDGDRISLVGPVDDISVDELVACIVRRGWTRVELTGDAVFRAEATRKLMRLSPPVEVANNPLPALERAAIRVEVAGDQSGVDWTAMTEEPAPAYGPRF